MAVAVEAHLRAVQALDPVLDLALARVPVLDRVLAQVDQAAQARAPAAVPRPQNARLQVQAIVGALAKASLVAAAEVRVQITRIRKKRTIRKKPLRNPNRNKEAGRLHLLDWLVNVRKELPLLGPSECTLAD